jgi:hypothetical protein
MISFIIFAPWSIFCSVELLNDLRHGIITVNTLSLRKNNHGKVDPFDSAHILYTTGLAGPLPLAHAILRQGKIK